MKGTDRSKEQKTRKGSGRSGTGKEVTPELLVPGNLFKAGSVKSGILWDESESRAGGALGSSAGSGQFWACCDFHPPLPRALAVSINPV